MRRHTYRGPAEGLWKDLKAAKPVVQNEPLDACIADTDLHSFAPIGFELTVLGFFFSSIVHLHFGNHTWEGNWHFPSDIFQSSHSDPWHAWTDTYDSVLEDKLLGFDFLLLLLKILTSPWLLTHDFLTWSRHNLLHHVTQLWFLPLGFLDILVLWPWCPLSEYLNLFFGILDDWPLAWLQTLNFILTFGLLNPLPFGLMTWISFCLAIFSYLFTWSLYHCSRRGEVIL